MSSTSTNIPENDFSASLTGLQEVIDVDVSLLDLLFDKTEELGPEVINDPKYNSILSPFDLVWCISFNPEVPMLNLTSSNRHLLFTSAAHVGLLYDYLKRTESHLKAHQNIIVNTSADGKGRWIATVDLGKDNMLVIWDVNKRLPVFTIFKYPPPGCKRVLIELSPSAKFLVTVIVVKDTSSESESGSGGKAAEEAEAEEEERDESYSYSYDEEKVVKVEIWLWTYGRTEPDASYTFEEYPGVPKCVAFHPNKEEHIMMVFSKAVAFFTWDPTDTKLSQVGLHFVKPASIGEPTGGTYIEYCHHSIVSTNKGYLMWYANSLYIKSYEESGLNNAKIHLSNYKMSPNAITCIKSSCGFIIICNVDGQISFYDKLLQPVYWLQNFDFGHIISMSFPPIYFKPRKNRRESTPSASRDDSSDESSSTSVAGNTSTDRTMEFNRLLNTRPSIDASVQHLPLFTEDFFFSRPHLVIAYAGGDLILHNFETHIDIVSTVLTLPKHEDYEEEENEISTIQYSLQSLHLVCATTQGDFFVLQPVLLTPKQHFRHSICRIVKIVFAKDNLQAAYYDTRMTVFGLTYDYSSSEWQSIGKIRTHYREIKNILFTTEKNPILYTIGADRYLVQYQDLLKCEEISVSNRERIEQRDVPTYLICYPAKKFSKTGYFLLADNMHKYKILNDKTMMCTSVSLGPAYGCFRSSPLNKIRFLTKYSYKYLVVSNDKHLGLQMLPLDGNPYRFMGCLAHPTKLLDFRLSADCKYVFTCGEGDRTVFQWKIKLLSVDALCQLGGEELQPYYCLLEGGKNGFLFREMQDLFYYMQILQQGENVPLPRYVTDRISLTELPDLVKACGYYPSDYEIENMMTDVRYKDFDETGNVNDSITFVDFVKLYINHRPPYGYNLNDLAEAFDKVSIYDDEGMPGVINKETLIEELTNSGEALTIDSLLKCFTTLMGQDEDFRVRGDRDFEFLADWIQFDDFTQEILGIDMAHKDVDLKSDVEEEAS